MTGTTMETGFGGSARFEKTHWTVVLNAARDPADTCAREALEQLCKTYWMPLYCFARRNGKNREEAKDLTQGFFVHLLANHTIASADPAKGSFHSFLLRCFKNFMLSEWQKAQAQKRSPGSPILSFDADQAETQYRMGPVDKASPDRIYERDCAWALVEEAVGKLRAQYKARGKGEVFEALSPKLMGDPLSYNDLAKRFHTTVEALRTEVSRMRKDLRTLLMEMLRPMTGTQEDVELELKALLKALSL